MARSASGGRTLDCADTGALVDDNLMVVEAALDDPIDNVMRTAAVLAGVDRSQHVLYHYGKPLDNDDCTPGFYGVLQYDLLHLRRKPTSDEDGHPRVGAGAPSTRKTPFGPGRPTEASPPTPRPTGSDGPVVQWKGAPWG